MIIDVTQRHIDDGRRAVACRLSLECNCPLSLAVADAGFENPRVRFNTFTAGSRSDRRRYALPREAARFIEEFDDSRHVEPFEFEVDEHDYTLVLEEAPLMAAEAGEAWAEKGEWAS